MAEIYIERGENDKALEHLEVAKELAEEAKDRDAIRRINRLFNGLD